MSVKTDTFINKIAPMAIEDMKETGVLASLTIAQAILESGWGESELAQKANNLFGIKCGSYWTGKSYNINTKEYVNNTAQVVSANFRAYDSWKESVSDHSKLLQSSRYVRVLQTKDYKVACQEVYQAGYATNSNYPNQLIQLIEQYDLAKYDKVETSTDSKAEQDEEMYRVRLSWQDANSQIGAYRDFNNAKKKVSENQEYKIFNSKGEVVFEVYMIRILSRVPIYSQANGNSASSQFVDKGEAFTIIDESNGYLKLKSNAGWLKKDNTIGRV